MTQSDTPHDGMLRNCGLYLLGALDQAAESAFERHLAGCTECRHECERLGPAASGLAGLDSTDLSRPRRICGDGRAR
jgi:Putative zinc-finger